MEGNGCLCRAPLIYSLGHVTLCAWTTPAVAAWLEGEAQQTHGPEAHVKGPKEGKLSVSAISPPSGAHDLLNSLL